MVYVTLRVHGLIVAFVLFSSELFLLLFVFFNDGFVILLLWNIIIIFRVLGFILLNRLNRFCYGSIWLLLHWIRLGNYWFGRFGRFNWFYRFN